MLQKLFDDFIEAIPTLTHLQALTLDKELLNVKVQRDSTHIGPCCRNAVSNTLWDREKFDLLSNLEARFSKHPKYSFCSSEDAIRWGVRDGKQRYRCKPCGATFCSLTGTVLSGMHHADKWGQYLQGMTHSLTLRPAAAACEIDLRTSFRWRHRFLSVFCSDQADELSGIVELDETFLNESFNNTSDSFQKGENKGRNHGGNRRE